MRNHDKMHSMSFSVTISVAEQLLSEFSANDFPNRKFQQVQMKLDTNANSGLANGFSVFTEPHLGSERRKNTRDGMLAAVKSDAYYADKLTDEIRRMDRDDNYVSEAVKQAYVVKKFADYFDVNIDRVSVQNVFGEKVFVFSFKA